MVFQKKKKNNHPIGSCKQPVSEDLKVLFHFCILNMWKWSSLKIYIWEKPSKLSRIKNRSKSLFLDKVSLGLFLRKYCYDEEFGWQSHKDPSSRVRKHKINKSQTNEKLLRRKGFRNKKNCEKYAKIFSPSLLLICQYILHLSIFIEHLFPFSGY